MNRPFARSDRQSYTNEEKLQLAECVERYKHEYGEEVKKNEGKTRYDARKKKHVPIIPKGGFVAKAVRNFYSDLKDVRNDDENFDRALKLAKRSYQEIDKLRDGSTHEPKKKRAFGGGRKVKAPEVKEALFNWFIYVLESLKGRLPRRLFKLKANQLYGDWLMNNPTPEKEMLKFGNHWIKDWENEYGISLRKPNKRFSISKEDLVERLEDYLKNIWTIRKFFLDKYNVDPPIINGDQMPLHRNESSQQKTLNFKGVDTFVKENHMLSRERITVFTQVSNDSKINLKPEFVFKGKGTRTKVNVASDVKYQWSESGSYRIEQMKKTIENLPNRFNPFTQKNFAIYVLDDYAVHLMPEVRKMLYQRGYILVVMGGGIAGFIQLNDTHLHRKLKALYRSSEMELMLKHLERDKTKIPKPSREEMISMVHNAWKEVDINYEAAFKQLFVTNALDGSEDFIVSDKLYGLVGIRMTEFRKELLKQSFAENNIQNLVKKIIPPKGIRRKNIEGTELLNYFDTEADVEDDMNADDEEENSSDDEAGDQQMEQDEPTTSESHPDDNQPRPSIASLKNLCNDDDINKDAHYLDEYQRLLEGQETSDIFKPHLSKMKSAFFDARRALKKRIIVYRNNGNSSEEHGDVNTIINEDDRNIFSILEDM